MARVPGPKCRHARRGIVTAGGRGAPHAATNVCDRAACIADARRWAQARTGQPARHIPDTGGKPARR